MLRRKRRCSRTNNRDYSWKEARWFTSHLPGLLLPSLNYVQQANPRFLCKISMKISRIYDSRRGEKSIHEFSKEHLDEFNWKTSKPSRGIERRNDRFGAYFLPETRQSNSQRIEKQRTRNSIRTTIKNSAAFPRDISAFPRTMTRVSSLPRSKEKKFTAAISGGGVVPQPVYLNFSSHYRSFRDAHPFLSSANFY